MMGMSLTYCLLHPSEVVGIKELIQQEQEKLKALSSSKPASITSAPIQAVPIQNAVAPINQQRSSTSTPPVPISIPEPHALDPNVPQLLPFDDALVPYNEQQEKENPMETDDDPVYQFDLMSTLSEFEAPNDEELVFAVIQVENSTNKTIIMKKSPKLPPPTTFTNCTSGNIETLNIHIQKH